MPYEPSPAENERNRALVRGLHLDRLAAAGHARAAALKEADLQLDRIAQLLPDAASAGLSLSEIARIAGVSRQTLYELRARYGESPRDFSLAVLQTVATRGAVRASEVAEHLRQPVKEVAGSLRSFADQGFVISDIEEDEDGPYEAFFLSREGGTLLEEWPFHDAQEGETEQQ